MDTTRGTRGGIGARRVVIAPDSFKGSIGAAAAAEALAAGWRSVEPDAVVVLRPMADGGEGTVAAFAASVPGSRRMPVTVTGPDAAPVEADWLLLPASADAPAGTAVVELASTSGIELLGERRLPWDADTTGFGQAIVAALDHGVSRLVLGIGSSASTDGGAGLLRALGAGFSGVDGAPIAPGARGLRDLERVDLSGLRAVPPGGAIVLTDVTNPLVGPAGAAAVFGPQKGFDADGVQEADAALARFARLVGADPATAGSGAAGGAGFALHAWGAGLVPGAPQVAELIALEAAVAAADVVLTGEGSFDGQSAAGKVPSFVSAVAREAGVAVALVAGRIAPDAATAAFAASVSLTVLAGSPEASLADPARWLHEAGASLARLLPRG
ncbi:glycerate kinase [Microbacterium sp. BWT-B31]|uniref:glycerate kinase n=1 Tax=Microbacterium sp. BWT-B31 TaxID=3232072 RepID=UPI0035284491